VTSISGSIKMDSVDDAFSSDDEHVRYEAYCQEMNAGETSEELLDRLAADPDQVMADGVRIRLIERASSRDGITAHTVRADFGSKGVQQKARECIAVLDAREATSPDQLLAVVATGFKRAHLEVLDRSDLPTTVLEALSRDGATKAVRNRANEHLRRRR